MLARDTSIVLLAAALFACEGELGRNREEATKLVRTIGEPTLVIDAGQLKQYAPPGSNMLVPRSAWPDGITRLQPEEVRVTPQGVYIERLKRSNEEHGVFIAFAATSVRTQPDRNPAFSPIEGRIYSYTIRR
jgi:hypothetical protein